MSVMRMGWKILNKDGGSLVVHRDDPDYRIYRRGDIVRPHPGAGPLAVFTNYVDAYKFWLRQGGRLRQDMIVKVVYIKSKKTALWGTSQANKVSSELFEYILGTDLADEVCRIS